MQGSRDGREGVAEAGDGAQGGGKLGGREVAAAAVAWQKAQPKPLPAPRAEAPAAAPAPGGLLAIYGPAAPTAAPEQVDAAAPARPKRQRTSARPNDDDKASVARRGSPERIEKVEICCVMMWERGRGAVRAVVQLGSWNVDQPRRGGTRWLGRSTSAPSDGHSSTVRAS